MLYILCHLFKHSNDSPELLLSVPGKFPVVLSALYVVEDVITKDVVLGTVVRIVGSKTLF